MLIAVAECRWYGLVGDDCMPSGYNPPSPAPAHAIVTLCSKISLDGGSTWGKLRNLTGVSQPFPVAMNPTTAWDETRGRMLMSFHRYNYSGTSPSGGPEVQLWSMSSIDGDTWSAPVNHDTALTAIGRNGTVP